MMHLTIDLPLFRFSSNNQLVQGHMLNGPEPKNMNDIDYIEFCLKKDSDPQ